MNYLPEKEEVTVTPQVKKPAAVEAEGAKKE